MERKKFLIVGLALLLIISSSVVLYLLINDEGTHYSSNKHLQLQDTFAYVYYSSSIAGEWAGDGTSHLIWIDSDGHFRTTVRSGLELNSVIPYGHQLILHKKNSAELFGDDGSLELSINDCRVHTGYGQSSGVLDNGIHYSVFNQRMGEDNYISTLRWGDAERLYCKEFDGYVFSVGDHDSSLYIIATDIMNLKDIYLIEYQFQDVENITEHRSLLYDQNTEHLMKLTNLVWHQNKLYGVFHYNTETNILLTMAEIDLDNRTDIPFHVITSYDLDVDPMHFFFNPDSIASIDDRLLFVDGFGNVHAYDPVTHQDKVLFTFSDYARQEYWQDEKVYFSGDRLYFYYYHRDLGSHVIDTYSLDGIRENRLKIPGIFKAFGDNTVFLYDFGVIRDHPG
ncbi:hypothetical protein [Insulibacter thermoxylanivorax]|uniref:hypothetical protein n=1 Tax=Insulibacter thermoxylanivorax TaxID=2749268 RepID=UPI0019101EA2|nr:hypothetical protein [Insulibacter thermoxylanivorax]